jgi:hypothetical protein
MSLRREAAKRAAPPEKKEVRMDDLQSDAHVSELIARCTKKKMAPSIKPQSSSVPPKSPRRKTS